MTDRKSADFEGMTTNERLFVSGLLGKFDEARASKDYALIRSILEEVFLDEQSIEFILKDVAQGRM